MRRKLGIVAATAALCAPAASAQPSEADLAKQLSNPVASLISVPLQSNSDFGLGPDHDGFQNTLNVQPVVPISLSEDWNVISRTILPIVYQDHDVVPGGGAKLGIGDVTQSLFFSPKETGPLGVIWGAGPVFLLDTASDDRFGADEWAAGPTIVALRQSGPWTCGILANHLWGFADDEGRADVNATFLQPFLSYTTSTAFTLTLNTESSYDWEGGQWTVPINLVASQVVKIGSQRISIGLGGRYFAEAPEAGPRWGVRFVVTLLFPK